MKLARVNFKDNYKTMEEYNKILFPLGCFFEHLGVGFGQINRLTKFKGNLLVINKENNLQKYHMINLHKKRIAEKTFKKDSMLRDSEDCFFSYFQYRLHKLNNFNAKGKGRQPGQKIFNNLI